MNDLKERLTGIAESTRLDNADRDLARQSLARIRELEAESAERLQRCNRELANAIEQCVQACLPIDNMLYPENWNSNDIARHEATLRWCAETIRALKPKETK
jgi:hypothetical protein